MSDKPEVIEDKRILVRWKAITFDFGNNKFMADRFKGHIDFFYDYLDKDAIKPLAGKP